MKMKPSIGSFLMSLVPSFVFVFPGIFLSAASGTEIQQQTGISPWSIPTFWMGTLLVALGCSALVWPPLFRLAAAHDRLLDRVKDLEAKLEPTALPGGAAPARSENT